MSCLGLRVGATLTLIAALGGCAASSDARPHDGSAAPTVESSTVSRHTDYPVTITDCQGRQLTFERAPTRVVTFDPSVTEILVTLGLADRIVGATLFESDGDLDLWPAEAETIQRLPIINDPEVGWPSKEAVVAVRADFVATGIAYSYDATYGVATREQFATLGIPSYLTHGACDVARPWHDLATLYEDMRDFGLIFDVQDRAEAEIADLQAQVEAQQERVREAGLPDYRMGQHYGGSQMPLTTGVGSANAVIELAGSHYALLDDDDGNNGSLSWEIFIERDPEVIWTISGVDQDAAHIRAQLEDDPRLSGVTAIRERAYVDVPYGEVQESPRIIDGLVAMVDGLMALQPAS